MQLTEHFADTELAVAGCEQRLIDNATALCAKLLEPVRAEFGPVHVDDGYRDPAHNARAGGKPASQHLYVDGNSAADIRTADDALAAAFDWMRLESGLPFDQAILEYAGVDDDQAAIIGVDVRGGETFYDAVAKWNTARPACIHLSYDSGKTQQRREALFGFTGAATVYLPAEVK